MYECTCIRTYMVACAVQGLCGSELIWCWLCSEMRGRSEAIDMQAVVVTFEQMLSPGGGVEVGWRLCT